VRLGGVEFGRAIGQSHRDRALRRARPSAHLRQLCRKNGGDLIQIKFLLGHASIQTTERYLGSEQAIAFAVNDNLGL
jgi:integrase